MSDSQGYLHPLICPSSYRTHFLHCNCDLTPCLAWERQRRQWCVPWTSTLPTRSRLRPVTSSRFLTFLDHLIAKPRLSCCCCNELNAGYAAYSYPQALQGQCPCLHFHCQRAQRPQSPLVGLTARTLPCCPFREGLIPITMGRSGSSIIPSGGCRISPGNCTVHTIR